MNPPNARADSHSRTSSTHAPASAALRPRTKRLISGLDDLSPDIYSTSAVITPGTTPLESPFYSRAPSPIPSRHPSRSSSINPSQSRRNIAGSSDQGSDFTASLSGFWGKSWTSLQGLASNVLGSDVSEELVKDKSPQRIRKPTQSLRHAGTSPSKQWGPPALTQPGGGSKDERKALVISKKREELLRSHSGLFSSETSRHKRRTSDDFDSSPAPGEDQDLDTLVYVHHVVPTDTLPGLSIKFNCPLPTIKKANRLWSNDGIQFRKTIVLPVDNCNVKGRRVAGPGEEQVDILGDGSDDIERDTDLWMQGRTGSASTIIPTTTRNNGATPTNASTKSLEESPWKHDSWILLSGHPAAIEIARLSRQDLGYFPRTRRKSVSYSDLDTPSASFDLPRPSISISDPPTTDRLVQNRPRRSSSTKRFGAQMIGPGGVGTLGGRGPSAPGPAEDKLNKVFGKHLPNILPNPTPAALDDDPYHSGTSTPVLGLENMGSAIEGWVRKIAKSAAKAVEPPSSSQQMGKAVGIRAGSGDLIELSDAFELTEDDEDEEEETSRGRQVDSNSSALEDIDLAVRERAFGGVKSKGA